MVHVFGRNAELFSLTHIADEEKICINLIDNKIYWIKRRRDVSIIQAKKTPIYGTGRGCASTL